MLDFKSVRPIDAAIVALTVVVILVGGFLGYQIWAQNRQVEEATPAARAIDALVDELRKDPNNIDKRMRLAQTMSLVGRDDEATEQYEAILTINKEYTPAIAGIGFIAMKQQDWATGEKYFRKVVELEQTGEASMGPDTQLETAYFYLGTALMEQKQYEEAAGYFKQALRIRRDASDTYYALAICLRELGNEVGYRENLENTLAFDPKFPEANYDLAMLLLKDGDIAKAAELFRASADEAKNAEKPRAELDRLGPFEERFAEAQLLAEKNPKKALVEARIAVALEPRDVEALTLLGDLYAKTGKNEEATDAYKRALAIDPQNPEAQEGLKRVADES